MKKFIPFIPFVLLLALVGSCAFGAIAKQAEPVAEKFYTLLQQGKYDAIIGLLDEDALAADPPEKWMLLFEELGKLGELKKFTKQMGFHTEIANGETQVTLEYNCEYEKGSSHETIVLQKNNEGFKILSYHHDAIK